MSQSDSNPLDPSALLEPLPGHSSLGRLERILRRGEFAVTAELNPPDSANPHDVYERAAIFDGWVDGINAVDASGANAHMSSVGICALADPHGLRADHADFLPRQEPHRHSGRRTRRLGHGGAERPVPDRRRRAGRRPARRQACFRSRLHVAARNHPDHARQLEVPVRPQADQPANAVFLGAAINPFAPPHDFRPHRLAKKIAAGAQFVQSQYCYDVPMFRKYMQQVRDMGLDKECFICAASAR
jgi:hypothetical protein